MKLYGEILSDQVIMEKILRTYHFGVDHFVITIEETKKLSDLKIEDLQGTLEAHEMKVTEIVNERQEEQALLARFKKEESKKEFSKKEKGKGQYKDKHKRDEKPKTSKDGGDSSKNHGKNIYFDKKKKHYFNWDKYGHITSECWFNKDRKSKNDEQEANVAQEDSNSDYDRIMLMATTSDKDQIINLVI